MIQHFGLCFAYPSPLSYSRTSLIMIDFIFMILILHACQPVADGRPSPAPWRGVGLHRSGCGCVSRELEKQAPSGLRAALADCFPSQSPGLGCFVTGAESGLGSCSGGLWRQTHPSPRVSGLRLGPEPIVQDWTEVLAGRQLYLGNSETGREPQCLLAVGS